MSEREINERRNWKAQVFPYDYFIPDDSRECQYCLTDKQAEILRGIIEPLAWHTRWWSDSDTSIDQDAITAFRDDLTRRLMMSCCGDEVPVQYRYTSDGVLQRSEDGGSTWTDAPEYDPRVYSTQFPPMSGDDGEDKKCIAATGAAALIKEQVGDQLTDDMSRYTLGQLITDWVTTMIQTSNPFQALVTVVANQVFALIIAVLRPALTDDVYHTLQCIFYCDIGDNASVNNAQWQAIRSDITDQISGIAGVFLEHLIYLLGTTGTTNLLRAGGSTEGDCSDCPDCDACSVTLYWAASGGTVTKIDECTWRFVSVPESTHEAVYVWFDNPTSTFDATKCGQMISYAVHSGSAGVGSWNECNTAIEHAFSDPAGHCASQLYFVGAGHFEIDVFVEACP